MPNVGEQTTITYNSTYNSREAMQKEVSKWSNQGWKVVSQSTEKEPFKIGKGCALGCLFLPLAIFARGKNKFIVIYEYVGMTKENNQNKQK